MTALGRELIEQAAIRCGVEPSDVTSYRRCKFLVRERIAIAKLLDARGYTSPQIGKVLRRDHTTVLFYLQRGQKKPACAKLGAPWRQPKVRHIRWLKPPPSPVYVPKAQRRCYLVPYAGADMSEYHWQERS